MKNLYVVMGGIGKNLLWTSLIPSLCNKDKVDRISVMSPWAFLFKTNKQNLKNSNQDSHNLDLTKTMLRVLVNKNQVRNLLGQ